MEKLENEWANALNDGDKVRGEITPNYMGIQNVQTVLLLDIKLVMKIDGD